MTRQPQLPYLTGRALGQVIEHVADTSVGGSWEVEEVTRAEGGAVARLTFAVGYIREGEPDERPRVMIEIKTRPWHGQPEPGPLT